LRSGHGYDQASLFQAGAVHGEEIIALTIRKAFTVVLIETALCPALGIEADQEGEGIEGLLRGVLHDPSERHDGPRPDSERGLVGIIAVSVH